MSMMICREFVELVKEYVSYQSTLQGEFFKKNSKITDWKFLTDCPRNGVLGAAEANWIYRRHGVGIRFESERGLVIDVHNHISLRGVVDAHRISEYLISKKPEVDSESDVYVECTRLLKGMEVAGLLRRICDDEEAWILV